MHRLAITVLSAAAFAGACAPTYAPPMRSLHVGAPQALSQGRLELAAGASVHQGWSRGAALRIGLPDDLGLELASDVGESWQLGVAGVRWVPDGMAPASWVLDLEAGLGAGLGGVLCGNPVEAETRTCDGDVQATTDGREWSDRLAWGGYAGAGLARHWDWFALFGRARSQLSTATYVPTTVWWSSILGGQITLFDQLRLHAGVGAVGFDNRMDREAGWILDAGLALIGP